MGWLHYENLMVPIEDRALAHLEIVLFHKLHHDECFLLRWRVAPENGSGRVALWCAPGIALRFQFNSAEPVKINRAWIRDLITSSYSIGGVDFSDEPLS